MQQKQKLPESNWLHVIKGKVQFLLTFPQYYNISPTSAIAASAEQHANTYFNITESECASNLSHQSRNIVLQQHFWSLDFR